MKAAGADSDEGLHPRFLELKRLVPKLRREQPGFSAFVDELAAAPCFVLPGDDSPKIPVYPEAYAAAENGTLLLPHDPCLFEVERQKKPVVMSCSSSDKGGFWNILPWVTDPDGAWSPWRFWLRVFHADGAVEVHATRADEDMIKTFVEQSNQDGFVSRIVDTVIQAAWFCTSGPVRTETRMAGSTTRHLMQAKGIRGWQYKMVTLDPGQATRANASNGGTHASPRWHLRRAHVRRLKDGRVVPVRSCEVGSPEHGGIVKDYQVEEHILAQHRPRPEFAATPRPGDAIAPVP